MRESSMSAKDPNVHFREHDIEFLQERTKLWLETVLDETYGDRSLKELVSDGNLLFRVAKHILREMSGASPGRQEMSPRTFAEVSDFGKSSGKYLPYANVDSFLKACKKVGLTDVELFTPPDAVEGKDIRRVCTSVRTLSRKARAQHIRVPDFEDVNRPLAMPKEKVEEIKETLQHSHSSPITPTAHTPEADIVKSERVQIIRKFLSSTTNPLYVPEEDGASISASEPPSPVTPGPFSTRSSPPSTPPATIGGPDTPKLTKSVSAMEPSPIHVQSAKTSLPSSPRSIASNAPNPDETLKTRSASPELPVDGPNRSPSPESPVDGPNDICSPESPVNGPNDMRSPQLPLDGPSDLPSPELPLDGPNDLPSPELPVDEPNSLPSPFARKTLGSFRHANPHFIKRPASQTNLPGLADNLPGEIADSHLNAEETLSLPAVSEPTTPDSSSDRSADSTNESPTLGQIGLGKVYRHQSPHFSFKKSAEAGLTDSEGSQANFSEAKPAAETLTASHAEPKASSSNKIGVKDLRSILHQNDMPGRDIKRGAETSTAPHVDPKAPSSNKIGVKDPRSTLHQTELPGSASFGPAATKQSNEPANEPEAKAPGILLNPRFWVPLVAGAFALVGALLLVRSREPDVYEVKEGDTLSTISKKVGKKGWDELVRLNPSISNPDLIYPSDKLKLSS